MQRCCAAQKSHASRCCSYHKQDNVAVSTHDIARVSRINAGDSAIGPRFQRSSNSPKNFPHRWKSQPIKPPCSTVCSDKTSARNIQTDSRFGPIFFCVSPRGVTKAHRVKNALQSEYRSGAWPRLPSRGLGLSCAGQGGTHHVYHCVCLSGWCVTTTPACFSRRSLCLQTEVDTRTGVAGGGAMRSVGIYFFVSPACRK